MYRIAPSVEQITFSHVVLLTANRATIVVNRTISHGCVRYPLLEIALDVALITLYLCVQHKVKYALVVISLIT